VKPLLSELQVPEWQGFRKRPQHRRYQDSGLASTDYWYASYQNITSAETKLKSCKLFPAGEGGRSTGWHWVCVVAVPVGADQVPLSSHLLIQK
jgi:hypothetical protein